MRRVCVFCGSQNGDDPAFKIAAQQLGKDIVTNGLELVYGGGHVGLMGVVADSTIEAGGKVIGIMPENLVGKELAHTGLSELKIVKSMHERKFLMSELSDGFIALPGGYGTLEEFCEMITGSMLGFHKKPCAVLNTKSYFDHLLKFFDTAVVHKFITQEYRDLILVSDISDDLLKQMQNFRHKAKDRWPANPV